jgi:hypothetical protein
VLVKLAHRGCGLEAALRQAQGAWLGLGAQIQDLRMAETPGALSRANCLQALAALVAIGQRAVPAAERDQS